MNVEFEKDYLADLYEKGKMTDKKHRFQPNIVKGYLKCVKVLMNISRMEDLFTLKIKDMGKLANNLQSFTPYHPGELVKDELEYRAIKQKDFAEKFNISYSVLNEVLNGKRNITSEFALVLEAALGIKADVLVRIQTDYNLDMARNSDKLKERLNNIRKIAAAL